MDNDTRAALNFYKEVHSFSMNAKSWEYGAIWYETLLDERWDATLISERVYGRRDEHLAVMAACRVSTVEEPIKVGMRVAFPNESILYAIKRRTGFESRAELREDGQPVWL